MNQTDLALSDVRSVMKVKVEEATEVQVKIQLHHKPSVRAG